ncbi:MAG: phage tail protein [Azoarcus sp.]|nr:phage tail protein [Azoarcus sp.]
MPGNKLLAVGNFPDTYKPLLEEGAAKDLVIRMIVQVANASLVTLKIDPAVVVATQKNLAQAIAARIPFLRAALRCPRRTSGRSGTRITAAS